MSLVICDHCNGTGHGTFSARRKASVERLRSTTHPGNHPSFYICGKCNGRKEYDPELPTKTRPLLCTPSREPDAEFTINIENPLGILLMFPVDRWHDYLNWCSYAAAASEDARYSNSEDGRPTFMDTRTRLREELPPWLIHVAATSKNPLRFRFPCEGVAPNHTMLEREKMMAYKASDTQSNSIQLV